MKTQEDAYGEWLVEDCMSRLTVEEHRKQVRLKLKKEFPLWVFIDITQHVDKIIQAAFDGGYEHGRKEHS